MDLPPGFLIDGTDSMGISLRDGQAIINSSRSLPPLPFEFVEMNTPSQSDSRLSDVLVDQQTAMTEIGVSTII
jgi:hypothetical protein